MTKINKKWLAWFIGFCDAEGNFQIFPKKRLDNQKILKYYNVGYGFHLALSKKDQELLYHIQSVIKLGKIYNAPNKNESRFYITQLKELNILFSVIDTFCLLTAHQYTNYNKLKYGVINKINRFDSLDDFNLFKNENNSNNLQHFCGVMEKIPVGPCGKNELDLTPFDDKFLHHWIIGFINGEGCFHIRKNQTFVFYIEQTEYPVLALIKKILQFKPSVLERKQRVNKKISFSLYISNKDDIRNLIIFLDKYNFLKGNKAVQYQYWKT